MHEFPPFPHNIGILLAETARIWRTKLDQRLHPLGLSQAKWVLLAHLAHGGEGMVQRDLAERMGVEGPTLVRLLDRMTRDGWIIRRDSLADRRSKTIHLTEKAGMIIKEISIIAAKLRGEILIGIPADKLECCADVIQKIKTRAEAL